MDTRERYVLNIDGTAYGNQQYSLSRDLVDGMLVSGWGEKPTMAAALILYK